MQYVGEFYGNISTNPASSRYFYILLHCIPTKYNETRSDPEGKITETNIIK